MMLKYRRSSLHEGRTQTDGKIPSKNFDKTMSHGVVVCECGERRTPWKSDGKKQLVVWVPYKGRVAHCDKASVHPNLLFMLQKC